MPGTRILACLLPLMFLPSIAEAGLLFYGDMYAQFGSSGTPRLAETYAVTPLLGHDNFKVSMKVGDSVSITAADGDVFSYNAGLATNGLVDFLQGFVEVPGAGAAFSMKEPTSFLEEAIIEEFRFTLDAFHYQTPGFDLNRNGNWTDYIVMGTLEIFGQGDPISVFPRPEKDLTPHFACVSSSRFTCPENSDPAPVPEPATFALFGSALAAMSFRKLRNYPK